MNIISLNFQPSSQSHSNSQDEEVFDDLIAHDSNEPTIVGLIFELKEEVDDSVNFFGYRTSSFGLVCGLWVLIGAAFGLHWWLQTLNVLKFIFSLILSYCLEHDIIKTSTRYYLSANLMVWCLWTGGLQSIYICNFIFHPMQVAFKWEYTRMFLFYLSVLYCFEVFGMVPVALHDTTNTPWWGTYCLMGFLMYVSYFISRIRSYVNNRPLTPPPTKTATQDGAKSRPVAPVTLDDTSNMPWWGSCLMDFLMHNTHDEDAKPRPLVPAELNYAVCFVGFGLVWSCCWFFFFAHVDNRMNYINLFYVLVALMNSWSYYDRHNVKKMHYFAFEALMILFTLYCLLTGGTNSPFFIILISVACFYHANGWMLQFSFFMFFLVYSSTFVLPKSSQTKLASFDLDSIYRLSFSSVILFLAVLYIFYPQSMKTKKVGAPKPDKKIMIQETPLVINRTRKLGRGTFGVVYEGKFGAHERVAIKVLRSVRRESRHGELKFLGHETYSCENVVKYHVYHTDNISQKHYIVMERCDSDLQNFLWDHPSELTLPLAISMMKDVLTGLKYIHGIGLLHRDLKSANILLSKVHKDDGTVSYLAKLTDFGCSIAQQGGTNTMASLCKIRGTLYFMGMPSDWIKNLLNVSPEIFATGEDDVKESERMATELSDVYSVGIVMWEIFNTLAQKSFSSPYTLRNGNQVLMQYALSKHVAKGNRPKIAKGFSTKFVKLYLHCVQPLPQDRPSVGHLIEKVEKYSKIPLEKMEFTTEEMSVNVKAAQRHPSAKSF